ncbi:Tat pathway signal sequence domain protein [Streptomyces canus]|uniref:sortase-dependent protein n=1 Tax=Streptomyces canus TaxID=58343 RepID=UPI002E2E46C9|nr:sortase-dependent protein [Streptomyces canus]
MRRTVLSAVALAATAVLGGTAPAFADGTSPTPSTTAAPADQATPASSAAGTTDPNSDPTQVATVPAGAPDTGVTSTSTDSGTPGALIGGGAAAAFAVGGAALFVVRRRRATGA